MPKFLDVVSVPMKCHSKIWKLKSPSSSLVFVNARRLGGSIYLTDVERLHTLNQSFGSCEDSLFQLLILCLWPYKRAEKDGQTKSKKSTVYPRMESFVSISINASFRNRLRPSVGG